MWQTMALAALLSTAPAQNAPLSLSNDRITFGGEFGPTRPNNQLLPGDIFYLAFDIDNLALDATGTAKYLIGMEVVDSAGKSVYSQKPVEQSIVLPLAGNKLPARAFVFIKPDQAQGQYTCRVTVTDSVTRGSKTLEKAYQVLPPQFGTVGLTVCHDPRGEVPAPFMVVAGQALWLHFGVVGFARDPATKQPHIVAELRAYDQAGKPTTEKPLQHIVNSNVPEMDAGVQFTFPTPLNRAGVFTLELKTEDKITGKNYKMSFPVTVMPSPK